MSLFAAFRRIFRKRVRGLGRQVFGPDGLGLRCFHLLVALSMLLPGLAGAVGVVLAAGGEMAEQSRQGNVDTWPPLGLAPSAIGETSAVTGLAEGSSAAAASSPAANERMEDDEQAGLTMEDTNQSHAPMLPNLAPPATPTPPPGQTPSGSVNSAAATSTTIIGLDGKVTLLFSPQTLSTATGTIDVYINPSTRHSGYSQGLVNFEILAFDKKGENISRFNKDNPVEIRIAYDESQLTGDEYGLTLFYFDEQLSDWRPLPSRVDVDNNVLTAWTDHFSDFSVDIQTWQAARTPTMDSWQVAEFTGAATYVTSLWVPPGPGGFQPELTLSYNSQVVDSASIQTQASWLGMGWSMNDAYIERDLNGTDEYEEDDVYTLIVNGVSSLLLPVTDPVTTNPVTYRLTNENFWKVEYNKTTDIWTVWDKTGNTYVFGDGYRAKYPTQRNDSSKPCKRKTWRWPLTSMENIHNQVITYTYWKESQVVDSFMCTPGSSGNNKDVDIAIYPDSITYPNNRYQIKFNWIQRGDFNYTWQNDTASTRFYQRSLLGSIEIRRATNVAGIFDKVIRTYTFTYDSTLIYPGWVWTGGEGTNALIGIQQTGVNGATLPGYSFEYDGMHLSRASNGYGGSVEFDYDQTPWAETNAPNSRKVSQNIKTMCKNNNGNPTGWSASNCVDTDNDGNRDALEIPGASTNNTLLQQDNQENFQPGAAYRISVNARSNGGGTITLSIMDRGNLISSAPLPLTNQFQGLTSSILYLDERANPATGTFWLRIDCSQTCYLQNYTITRLPMRYRVTERRLYSDPTAPPITFNYAYSGASTNIPINLEEGNSNDAATSNPYIEPYAEFRGHDWVQVTHPDGTVQQTWYNQDDQKKGLPTKTEIFDSGGKLLQRTDPSWGTVDYTSNAFMPREENGPIYTGLHIYWVRKNNEEVHTCDGANNCMLRRTVYEYVSGDQGGTQYGNLTRVREQSWNGSTWVNYRATRTWYFPTETASVYLVGLPAARNVYTCPGGVCNYNYVDALSSVLYIYDNRTNYYDPPTAGKLTDVRTWMDDLGSGNTRYSQVSYVYDAWGNPTQVKTWDTYGTASADPPGNARITSTVYDNIYHTYATSVTNPKGHPTTFTYDYDKGVPTSETDPNGNTTTATYDDFGRLLTIRRPGDATGSPTISITYNDTNQASVWPFGTTATQKIDANTSMTVRKYYDGLGRLIQTQTANAQLDSGIKDIIVDYFYDTAGRLWKQSVPYGVTPGSGYRTPSSQPVTVTTYDALGRVETVTATDGTTTAYAYTIATLNGANHLKTTLTDPRGNATLSYTDVWGRVVYVYPPANHPAISYSYDALDRLVQVDKGSTIVAQMWYDYAGRKTQMSDADMGMWTYEYDAAGNLTAQTDARGCTINFTYDTLDRLTAKTYSGPGACASTPAVSYTYDSGTNGLGQRTAMSDASGSTAWTYDNRGRLIQESKTINGAGTFKTKWGYNSADMLATMTYPHNNTGGTNEVLTYSYLPQGLLDRVATSYALGAYVDSTRYDAAGRMVLQTLKPNVLQRSFEYYGWNTQGGRLWRIKAGTSTNASSYQFLAYDYDPAGNITEIRDWKSGGPQYQNFTYDALNRLTSAQATGGTNGNGDYGPENYTYDGFGNLSGKAGANYVYDSSQKHAVRMVYGSSIGETGQVTNATGGIKTVTLSRSYRNPVVFIQPHSYNGADTSVVRITSVQPDRFSYYIDEAPDRDGAHTTETISYIVLEAGTWQLPNGTQLIVGTLDTSSTVGKSVSNQWSTVSFNTLFSSTPIVISQVQSNNDPSWVKTRQRNAGTNSFQVAMEVEDSRTTAHGSETIGWLAIEPGTGNWNGRTYEAGATPDSVTQNWFTITWNAVFNSAPRFAASIATYDGTDGSYLRYNNLTSSSVQVMIEEDTTLDSEINHTSEVVHFLAVEGDGALIGGDITIRAYSTVCNDGVRATMQLWVNGVQVKSWTNVATQWTDYTFNNAPLTGSDVIEIVFPNDCYQGGKDRNLYVDYVIVNGQTVQAETGAAIIDKTSGGTAFDGKNIVPGQQNIAWNGALRFVVGPQAYAAGYDENGNMTSRIVDGNAYILTYDAENRLVDVSRDGVSVASFVYDGDGQRVQSTVNGVTTSFVGNWYEWKNGAMGAKYYGVYTERERSAAGQRIAMRQDNGWARWLFTDHLGSTTLTYDPNGAKILEQRYTAWGEPRYQRGSVWQTRYHYTGQYSQMDSIGLMYYNARWYDPALGRFVSADSIVPLAAQGVQAWDRYAYVNNSPVNFNDPSGHLLCSPHRPCEPTTPVPPAPLPLPQDTQPIIPTPPPPKINTPVLLPVVSPPPWVAVAYYQKASWGSYSYGYVAEPVGNETLLPNPIFPEVPLVVGYETATYWMEDGTGSYLVSEAATRVGAGVPGANGGLQFTVGENGTAADLYVHFFGFGGSFGQSGAEIFNPLGGSGWQLEQQAATRYVLTTNAAVDAAGGFQKFGERYVFPNTNSSYRILRYGDDPFSLKIWFSANMGVQLELLP